MSRPLVMVNTLYWTIARERPGQRFAWQLPNDRPVDAHLSSKPSVTAANQPAANFVVVGRLFWQRTRGACLVELSEESIHPPPPGVEQRRIRRRAFARALPFNEVPRLRYPIPVHQAREIGLELAGRQQMNARERGAKHVEELLHRRFLLEERELVLGEADVVPVHAPAQ